MTKAQEVRNRWLESSQTDLTTQAEKVFDWILNLIDADIQKGFFRPIEVCLFDDQHAIRTTDLSDTQYDLGSFLLRHQHPHWRLDLFLTLQKMIEKEDGYFVLLLSDTILYDAKCILLQVALFEQDETPNSH